jgi:dTDP-4-dehydrorhamnose reductase
MKILLFGKNGQVGWELQRKLVSLGELSAVDREEVDFTNLHGLRDFTLDAKPDLIVNAAAYTDVDGAESEPEVALAINSEAPGVLAEAARKLGAAFVHYSTDYVFDGEKGEPYAEGDGPHPLNVYGETKLAGERAIAEVDGAYWILRTSWLYGVRGRNFFLTMLRLARERELISVVEDQVGCPTWCRSLALGTLEMLERALERSQLSPYEVLRDSRGIYHLCAAGRASWYDFARRILEWDPRSDEHIVTRVEPISSEAYPTAARRPAFSVLDTGKVARIFGVELADWEQQLRLCWQSAVQV